MSRYIVICACGKLISGAWIRWVCHER